MIFTIETDQVIMIFGNVLDLLFSLQCQVGQLTSSSTQTPGPAPRTHSGPAPRAHSGPAPRAHSGPAPRAPRGPTQGDIMKKLTYTTDANGCRKATLTEYELSRLYFYIDYKRERLAKVLVDSLFTQEERVTCNCRGIGKEPLDPVRLKAVEEAVFTIKPCAPSQRLKAWSDCTKSIDQHNRDLKRRRGIELVLSGKKSGENK